MNGYGENAILWEFDGTKISRRLVWSFWTSSSRSWGSLRSWARWPRWCTSCPTYWPSFGRPSSRRTWRCWGAVSPSTFQPLHEIFVFPIWTVSFPVKRKNNSWIVYVKAKFVRRIQFSQKHFHFFRVLRPKQFFFSKTNIFILLFEYDTVSWQ